MPTFNTPTPVSAHLELHKGSLELEASERQDTVVEVHPSSPSRDSDVKAAEQTVVSCDNGRLFIKTPKQRALFGRSGSVDVTVKLPTGSSVNGSFAAVDVRSEGTLGDCSLKSASGDIRLQDTASLSVKMASGTATAGRIDGNLDVSSASGGVEIDEVTGSGAIKLASGGSRIGKVGGSLRIKTASGGIAVDTVEGSIDAKTASGNISVGRATSGEVAIYTASGDLEVGIPEGTAAWLKLQSMSGKVRNELQDAGGDGPRSTEKTLKVQAKTFSGDVTIRRA